MIEKEKIICIIGTDADGCLYIGIPEDENVYDTEERDWRPSESFIEALIEEMKAFGNLGEVTLIEKGRKALVQTEEDYKILEEEEAAEHIDRELEKADDL